jgi:hypothetical protein
MFAAEKEGEIKELVARLHQERSETQVQRQLLQHLIWSQANRQLIDEPSITHVLETAEAAQSDGA